MKGHSDAQKVACFSTIPDAGNAAAPLVAPDDRVHVVVGLAIVGGGAGLLAYEDPGIIPQAIDAARAIFGPQPVALVESWVFQAQDRVRQARYQATGAAPQLQWAEPVQQPKPSKIIKPAKTNTSTETTPLSSDTTDTSSGPATETMVAWSPLIYAASGQPALERALVSPDPTRPYVQTALVRIDLHATQLHLIAGTQEPRSQVHVARPGMIPLADQRSGSLLAAFNGGFKAANGEFGMAAGGATLLPPIDRLATLAIYRDGQVKLGAWGSEIRPTPNLIAFRQNCPLLLDGGKPTEAANSDDAVLWGKTVGNKIATWRSGLGLSADGRYLIYAASDGLTVPTLAQALADAGADRAMQLDINSWWTRFVTYSPIGSSNRLIAQKLITSMVGDARQFQIPDTRDFFYVTAR